MEKLNYEYVKQYFTNNDCELLNKKYKNSKTKMEYVCQCGNYSKINFDNFKNGKRCKKCMGNKLSEDRRKDKQEIEALFLVNGCQLLGEYKHAHLPVQYQCSCGVISKITVANFKQGRRCKKCGIIKRAKDNHYNWCPDRQRIKDNISIRKRCYSMLYNSLKATGRKKQGKSRDLLGYTGKQLQEHIRNHPNWENIKDKSWEIDHVFPLKAFLDYNITDVSIINCLDNLAPILKTDNRKKSRKYNKVDFINWLQRMDNGY